MRYIIAAIALMLVATPAAAGWQGAEWGMTRAEVREALNLPLAEAPAPNEKHGSPDLLTRFSTQGLEFRVRLSFGRTSGRLEDIEFRLDNDRPCTDVEHLLSGMFGAPERVEVSIMRGSSWRDTGRGNRVALISFPRSSGRDHCGFGYSPLPTVERTGL